MANKIRISGEIIFYKHTFSKWRGKLNKKLQQFWTVPCPGMNSSYQSRDCSVRSNRTWFQALNVHLRLDDQVELYSSPRQVGGNRTDRDCEEREWNTWRRESAALFGKEGCREPIVLRPNSFSCTTDITVNFNDTKNRRIERTVELFDCYYYLENRTPPETFYPQCVLWVEGFIKMYLTMFLLFFIFVPRKFFFSITQSWILLESREKKVLVHNNLKEKVNGNGFPAIGSFGVEE